MLAEEMSDYLQTLDVLHIMAIHIKQWVFDYIGANNGIDLRSGTAPWVSWMFRTSRSQAPVPRWHTACPLVDIYLIDFRRQK